MTEHAKRRAATLLLTLALVAVVVGGVLWAKADSDADHQRIVNGYAIELGAPTSFIDSAEPDHTPAVAAFIVSGLAVLCAVILFASTGRVSDQYETERDQNHRDQ